MLFSHRHFGAKELHETERKVQHHTKSQFDTNREAFLFIYGTGPLNQLFILCWLVSDDVLTSRNKEKFALSLPSKRKVRTSHYQFKYCANNWQLFVLSLWCLVFVRASITQLRSTRCRVFIIRRLFLVEIWRDFGKFSLFSVFSFLKIDCLLRTVFVLRTETLGKVLSRLWKIIH